MLLPAAFQYRLPFVRVKRYESGCHLEALFAMPDNRCSPATLMLT
jgi:hypothetical protein